MSWLRKKREEKQGKAGKEQDQPKKSQLRDWTEALIVAAVLALIIRTFLFQAFKIPSGSMEDTLLIGDHLLVNKFIYGTEVPFSDEPILKLRDPQRGDIIVFEYPEDRDKSYFQKKDFIKRVIGLPGDTVEVRRKNVYINGERYITEQAIYRDDNFIPGHPRDTMAQKKVPANSYFVMGDNRDNSSDSRFWGFVDRSEIKGAAFIKYWSWDSEEFMPRWSRIGRLIE
ncbi:MAG: signal peptidase I [Desulfuromonadales bacterium]|nr:signal peptidase I [Desulfuromonadales bacterium]